MGDCFYVLMVHVEGSLAHTARGAQAVSTQGSKTHCEAEAGWTVSVSDCYLVL